MVFIAHDFPKREKLCGKIKIATLMKKGRWSSSGCVRFCYNEGSEEGVTRFLVSVPKRYFKRAVKRNLLKRRIREAYRLNKSLISSKNVDVMFVYVAEEVLAYSRIEADIKSALLKIAA